MKKDKCLQERGSAQRSCLDKRNCNRDKDNGSNSDLRRTNS